MKSAAASRSSFTKNNLTNLIQRAISDPEFLRNSAGAVVNKSTTLDNCINGIVPNGCNQSAPPQGISIVDSSGQALSGTPAAPARYDDEGRLCGPTPSAKCIFEVFTDFTARCGTMPSPCRSAQDIVVRFTIRNAREADGNFVRGIAGIAFSDVTGSVTTAVRTILSNLTNNYVPMMNGGTTSLTNSNIFQDTNGRIGINTTNPQTALDINGDVGFTINGVAFRSVLTNAGVRTRTFSGCYGKKTGYSDTCDGSFQLYQCPAGGVYQSSCFDIQSSCGGNNCGGCYFTVVCNAGLIFQQQ